MNNAKNTLNFLIIIQKITIALVHCCNKIHLMNREFGFAMVTFTDKLITYGFKIQTISWIFVYMQEHDCIEPFL